MNETVISGHEMMKSRAYINAEMNSIGRPRIDGDGYDEDVLSLALGAVEMVLTTSPDLCRDAKSGLKRIIRKVQLNDETKERKAVRFWERVIWLVIGISLVYTVWSVFSWVITTGLKLVGG